MWRKWNAGRRDDGRSDRVTDEGDLFLRFALHDLLCGRWNILLSEVMTDGKRSCGSEIGCKRGLCGSADGGTERNGSAKRGTGLESERRDLASAATEQAADARGGQKTPDFDKKLTNFTDRVSQTLLQSEGKCGIITKMSSEDGKNTFFDMRGGSPRRMANRPIERGVYVKGYVGKNQKSRA